jgi:hypothetical protein
MRGRTKEYVQSNVSVPRVRERKRPNGHNKPRCEDNIKKISRIYHRTFVKLL